MKVSTRIWIRRCFECQARTASQTVRWPVISMGVSTPVVTSCRLTISVLYRPLIVATPKLYSAPTASAVMRPHTQPSLETSPQWAQQTSLFTTVSGTMIVRNGPSPTMVSNFVPTCRSIQAPGYRKIATSTYHSTVRVGTKGVDSTMVQMLSMVVSDRQNDWNLRRSHVMLSYSNSVNTRVILR